MNGMDPHAGPPGDATVVFALERDRSIDLVRAHLTPQNP